jgi:hypothetical protein
MISYELLVEAKAYYASLGYDYIDVPWEVEECVSKITKPIDRKEYHLNHGVLVASGEQSFLQMIKNGNLPHGSYQCITPCFRQEPVIDETHKPYFMKLELIETAFPFKPALDQMIQHAYDFFSRRVKCKIVKTTAVNDCEDNTYDIVTVDGEIELGSYGMRWNHEHIKRMWLYGTGLAEPRFSDIINKMGC